MRTLVLGYAKDFLTMFVKRKKNRSGTTSVVVPEKSRGNYKELVTIGIAKDSSEIDSLVNAGYEWISRENSRRYPQLDLLTSSLKKSVFYNWLINNILYLCVPSFWGTQKIF